MSEIAPRSITKWLQGFSVERLHRFLAQIPETDTRNIADILALVESIGRYQLPGMASSNAPPVRTTFLHILYPEVVPIFDKMVLKAVGAWFEGANKKVAVLRQYLPHAWAHWLGMPWSSLYVPLQPLLS